MSCQRARLPVTVISLDNTLYGLAHRINQFATAHFPRLQAFTDDMLHMERPAPLYISHHSLPLLQILLDQPIDQALNLVFDLLRHLSQHLLLEVGSYSVTPHQLLDIGDPHGSIEEVEPALLESVQDVLHFCQAWSELILKIALVVFNRRF